MVVERAYNLEERTFEFARDCRLFLKHLKNTISNNEDSKQLVKSSGSIGANYIEANEKLGQKDFLFRLKIARKEAKESRYRLRLLKTTNEEHSLEFEKLIVEAEELRRILSVIINKVQ